MAIEAAVTYPQLSPRSYEHPADRAATSALHAVPFLDRLVKRLAHLGIERRYRQILLGDAVRLGPDQVPALWDLQTKVASCLDLERTPPLFITQAPVGNAMTFGIRNPSVIVFSSLAKDYTSDEVQAVLAHEAGHVLSDHQTYGTILILLHELLDGVFGELPLAGLPVRGLYLALLEWHRAAELTCDRAAAIEVGDPMVVCRLLMRLAGGAVPEMNIEAFIRQATEYAEEVDLFALASRVTVELGRTHPLAVRRVRELVTWVQQGDYDRIRGGAYVRRGSEAPVSAEFEAAVAHYRARFVGIVERATGGINRLSDQIATWLRRNNTGGDGDDEDSDDE